MRRMLVLATLLALALLAPGSGAAITLGPGTQPAVALDAAGTAYVVWRGPGSPSPLRFCRLQRNASRCDPTAPSTIAAPGNATNVSPPVVVVSGSRVVVLQYRTGPAVPGGFAVYGFVSNDGGTSFAPGATVGSLFLNQAVAGPGDTVSAVSRFTPALTPGLPSGSVVFQSISPAGAGAAPAVLSPGPANDGTIGLVDAGTPLAVWVNQSAAPYQGEFRRYSGSGDLGDQANWTPAGNLGPLELPVLAGGPKGLFLLGTTRAGLVVRRFIGATFSRPVALGPGRGGHLAQDAAGRLHVAYGVRDRNGFLQLVHGWSDNGTNWRQRNLLTVRSASGFLNTVRAAVGANHLGVVAWQLGTQIHLDRITPDSPAARRQPSLFGFANGRRSGPAGFLRIFGDVAPPPGVPAAVGCTGTVALSLVRAGRVVASRTIRVARTCAFSLSVEVPVALIAGASRVRFAFSGNRLLTPARFERALSFD